MSDERDYEYSFKREPKPGWPCPRCGGAGTNADGYFATGTDANGVTTVRVRHPSKCHLCAGTGRVACEPATQAGGPADE